MILLAAMDPMGLIGNGNKLPWNYPQDLKNFKSLTSNNIIVMGRKTWESLPKKPLPNRINVVVSNTVKELDGAYVIKKAEDIHIVTEQHPDKHIFLIGGGQLYTEWIQYCSDMIITHVKKVHVGDTYFLWNWMEWEPFTEMYEDADIRITHYRRHYGSAE